MPARKTTSTSTSVPKTTEYTKLEKENKELKKELEEIKKMLLINANQVQSVRVAESKESVPDDEYVEIPIHKQFRVKSLCVGLLILSTEMNGKGHVYRFNGYGSILSIPYDSLVNIVNVQQSFAEHGAFYIFDKQVRKNLSLEEAYKNILSEKDIDNILDFDNDILEEKLKNASKIQLTTIATFAIDKINRHEQIDYNKQRIISKYYGINIEDIAKNTQKVS